MAFASCSQDQELMEYGALLFINHIFAFAGRSLRRRELARVPSNRK